MPFTYARPPLRSYAPEPKSSLGTEWPAYSQSTRLYERRIGAPGE